MKTKRKHYTKEFKAEVVNWLKSNSMSATREKFNVPRLLISRWQKRADPAYKLKKTLAKTVSVATTPTTSDFKLDLQINDLKREVEKLHLRQKKTLELLSLYT